MKVIYRVYDVYCTGDSYLHTENKELADKFCASLNKKTPIGTCRVEEIIMEVPHWEEDLDCMPEAIEKIMDNGWVQWSGGESPVDDDVEVEYLTALGNEYMNCAKCLRWTWLGGNTARGGDIVAYRAVGK